MRTLMGLSTAALVVSTSLSACSSSSTSTSDAPSGPAATSSEPATEQSALDRWDKAYDYLSAQTKSTEISCSWVTASGAQIAPAPRPALFFEFSDKAAWSQHVFTRNDSLPKGTFEYCVATVPTTVPYGPEIQTFLGRFGLTFAADSDSVAGLTSIEIAYAGQNADDPDIIYQDKPGLFGLRIALGQLGKAPFEPGTSKIVPPTDDATASRYLRYAKPLLDWYRYKG